MEPEPEIIDQGPAPSAPRWVWWVMALVLVVGAAAWAVDERQQRREHSALADCRTRLQAADDFATARLVSMSDYIRPSLATVRRSLARRIAQEMEPRARLGIPPVEEARRVCGRLHVWSWHGTGQARLTATQAYADGLLDRLEEIAEDGYVYFQPDRHLERLRARAGLS